MFLNENIIVTNNVTLITLRNVPSDPCIISGVFETIANAQINIDMISQTAPFGKKLEISFTVDDKDFADVLKLSNKFREQYPDISALVNNENVKITVNDDLMAEKIGIAAQIFKAVAKSGSEIKLVTTSETQVSLLVAVYDEDQIIKLLTTAG